MTKLIGVVIVLVGLFFAAYGLLSGIFYGVGSMLIGGGIAMVAYGWKCIKGFSS
jgi:hypothetical protein